MAHSADDVDDADRRTRALYFFLYMYCDSPLRDSRSLEGPCRPSPCLCAYVCECVELIERQRERERKEEKWSDGWYCWSRAGDRSHARDCKLVLVCVCWFSTLYCGFHKIDKRNKCIVINIIIINNNWLIKHLRLQ